MLSNYVKHRATQNTLWLSVLQCGTYVAHLLLIPFLTRYLSVEEFGATMAALATAQFAFVITDYGFSLSGTYEVSKARSDRSRMQAIIEEVHSAKVVLIIVAVLAVVGISFIPAFLDYQTIFLAAVISIIGRAFQPTWFFQGIENMKFYAGYMSAVKLIYALTAVALVSGPGDGYLVLLSLGVADLLGAGAGLWGIHRLHYRVAGLSRASAISGLRNSWDYFVSRLAVAMYTSASSIIVGTAGLSQAALYAAAEQVYKAGQSVTAPINQALYPFMAQQKGPGLLFKIIPYVTIILIIGSSVIGYWAEPIVTLVFGPSYTDVVPILRVFLLTIVINYIGVSFGYPMFAAIHAPKVANKTVVVGSVFFIVLVTISYVNSGISAYIVAVSILITEAIVALLRIVSAVVIMKNHNLLRKVGSSEFW